MPSVRRDDLSLDEEHAAVCSGEAEASAPFHKWCDGESDPSDESEPSRDREGAVLPSIRCLVGLPSLTVGARIVARLVKRETASRVRAALRRESPAAIVVSRRDGSNGRRARDGSGRMFFGSVPGSIAPPTA